MNKVTKVLLAVMLTLCLLTACNSDDGPLEVYTLGENDTVVALDSILAENEAVLASIDAPTDTALQANLEVSHTYHYREMEDPALLAARYVEVLRGSEQGFQIIDQENRRVTEEPNMEIIAGSVTLAKAAAENEEAGSRIVRVIVGWSEYAVAIQVAYVDGKILPPEEKPKEEEEEFKPTAQSEQLDFFYSLNPEDLGMVGDDMNDYMVFPKQGWVQIDDYFCREMNVYLQDLRDGNNVYIGTFYLSSDMSRLYKKVGDTSIVAVDLG